MRLNLDFPDLLRGVLRQSPDVIMVGEIRDAITAQTAVRAANSGHLVLATLHAPSAAGAIQSMLSLEVHPHFLASCLRGAIAQRLVRTLCARCKVGFDLSVAPLAFEEVRQWLEPGEGRLLFAATGCVECQHTGYFARTGVFEVLTITPLLRHLILAREPTQGLRQSAVEAGMIRNTPSRPVDRRPRADSSRGSAASHSAGVFGDRGMASLKRQTRGISWNWLS